MQQKQNGFSFLSFFLFLSFLFGLVRFCFVSLWFVSPSNLRKKNNGHGLSFVQHYKVSGDEKKEFRGGKKEEGKLKRREVAPPDPTTIKKIFNPFSSATRQTSSWNFIFISLAGTANRGAILSRFLSDAPELFLDSTLR